MKKIILILLVMLCSGSIVYAEWVSGYTRKNGTAVDGYNRSNANDTVRDNYSYKGNTNPYTGQEGNNYNRNNPSSQYYGTQGRSNNTGWLD